MTAASSHRPAGWRRVARAPLLHFLLLGGALFGVRALAVPAAPEATISIGAGEVRALADGWRRRTGRAPGPRELDALVRAEIDDRLLLAAAYARGWHRTDGIVRRRLVRNQRFLAGDEPVSDEELLARAYAQGMDETDVVVRRRLLERMRMQVQAAARGAEPTHEALAAWLAAHPERFEWPERVRVTHVFLSRDRRGRSLATDAAALGARLETEAIPPERARELSDPLLVRTTFPLASEEVIARELGPGFAEAALRAPVGRWSGPVESAYGLHYVFVHARAPRETPPLDVVATRVRADLLHAREERALRDFLAGLRARADVRVERPAG